MTASPSPLPTSRVIRILLATAARRWANRISHVGSRFRRRKAVEGRTATAGKHQPSRIAAVLIMALYVVLGINFASGIVRNIAGSIRDVGDDQILVGRYMYRRIKRAETRMAEAESAAARDGKDPSAAKLRKRDALVRSLVEDALGRDPPEQGDPLSALHPAQRPPVEHMLEVFDARGTAGFRVRDDSVFLSEHPWAARNPAFRRLVALVLALTFIGVLLMSLGTANTDLGHVDWTLQWLFTFPIRARALFLAKTIEYALLNTVSWIIHTCLLFAVLWSVGYGGAAFPIALGGALYINLLLAVCRLLIETWLRKRLALQRLKNVQAVCTAAGTLCLLLIYMLSSSKLSFDLSSFAVVPDAVGWLPWSVPAMVIGGGVTAVGAAAVMVGCAVVVTTTGIRIAEHMVRDGLIVGGQRGPRKPALAGSSQARPRFSGIVGRELRLLLRDRNLLVQTLIVPVLVIGLQLVMNPQMFAGAVTDSRHAAALAFGIGAYVLMGGGFMALSNEGKALWLLFTFPRRIEQVLLRKAIVWGCLAALYTLAVIVVTAVLSGGVDLDSVIGSVTALVGVAIYAALAVGIGILGTNPLAEEVQRKIRPALMSTYMLLTALFMYGFYSPHWTKLVLVIVCALLAVAIWQIVRDRAPLLLDPVHRPAPRIALSDGLIAVLSFIVLQSVVVSILSMAKAPHAEGALTAFVIAGALVTLVALYVFWRRKVPDILATIGIRGSRDSTSPVKSVALGVVLGLGAGAVGVLYQRFALDTQPVELPRLFAVLAIVAAPVFEETLFRGLVFRGLRRSTHFVTAMLASAGIFAIVHPPASFVPVFGLGMATAYCFERTGRLIAPMCAHAVYNAMVVFVLGA